MKLSDSLFHLNTGTLLLNSNVTSGYAGTNRDFKVRYIRSGKVRASGNRESNMLVPAEPLKQALMNGMFVGKAMMLDHSGLFDYPSLRNLVGTTKTAFWNEETQSVDGEIQLNNTEAGNLLSTLMLDMLNTDQPTPDVGLSLSFWPTWEERVEGQPMTLKNINHIESIDFVFEPAADGRVLQAFSTLFVPQSFSPGVSMPTEPTQVTQPTNPTPDPAPVAEVRDWTAEFRSAMSAGIIQTSGLPEASQERLLLNSYTTPEEVINAVNSEKAFLARLVADNVIQIGGSAPRSQNIQLGLDSIDQIRLAVEALIEGKRPPQGIRPLAGIRELYTLLSGDYELTGTFFADRVQFANVNCTTMASLTANAMNKVVTNEFQSYPAWWQPAVTEVDFSSLQAVRWSILGGVGELPTVSEGASYTELTWDDKYETASFVKKGGYLGITLEAIDKDDTRKLQGAPRALAQAAWMTLSKSIAGIWTTNAALIDGVALFHGTHANLGATALSPSSWKSTGIAMMKQTELNSSERLGALCKPYLLWVPVDLEDYATQILGSGDYPDTGNNNINPWAEGEGRASLLANAHRRIVVCPIWTDTNDWGAQADPRMYPSIGLGFRYGRSPEVFSVASPTAGLMFTNDVMPVKVRFYFATGPIDYRGLYKHVVT